MGNTILITGSSSGIGKATAQYFADKGWNVAATMRRPENEKDLKESKSLKLIRLDVEDAGSIREAVARTIREFGGIDVVLNNAGYGATGPFEAANEAQIRRQFEVNVFGLMAVIQEVLPHLRERRAGTIINVSSIGGRVTFPLYSLYHGTKWCVEGFSESLSYELAPLGIRVKIVEPGAIRTDFNDRSADPLVKDGLTAYDGFVDNFKKKASGFVEKAIPPVKVAEVIHRAATDGSSRLRYLAGTDAKAFWGIRRWFGEGTQMGIVRWMLGR